MLDFLRFYNRTQKYNAEIRVNINNTANDARKAVLVVPVPRTTKYQTTVPEFREPTMEFPLELEAGETKVVTVPFRVHVMPRKYRGKIAPEIIQANEFVISYLTYGNPIKGLYSAEEVRNKRVVDCGGFDALLQDELKKKGIESKVVAGFWSDGKMHAWLEIEEGIPADPSMEWLRARGKTIKSGKLGFVGSDRIVFSIGEPFLQHPLLKEEDPEITYENYLYCTRT